MGAGESKYEIMSDMSDMITVEDIYNDHYLNWIEENWNNYELFDKKNKKINIFEFKKESKNIFTKYFSEFTKTCFPSGIKAKIFFFVITLITYLNFQGTTVKTRRKLFTVSYKNLFMMMVICEEFNISEDIIDVIFELVDVNKKFVDITYYDILLRQFDKERKYPKYLRHFKQPEISVWTTGRTRANYNQEIFLEYYLKKARITEAFFITNKDKCKVDFVKINGKGFSYSEINKIMKGFEIGTTSHNKNKKKSINFCAPSGLLTHQNETKKIKSVLFNYYSVDYFY